MIAGIIFLIVKGISKDDNKDEEDEIDKFTADLRISNAHLLNYSDINIKINPPEEDNFEFIVFIFYDNDSEITRRKIPIEKLEEANFQMIFHFANASMINKISIIPVFEDENGDEVEGEVEDQAVVEYAEGNEIILEEMENETFVCKSDSQCDDKNNCTTNKCLSNGNCSYQKINNCVACDFDSDCEDLNACTANKCSRGVCTYLLTPGCVSCYSNVSCEDSNPCTDNICLGGRCIFNPVVNCNPSNTNTTNTSNTIQCTTSNQATTCNDNNICTTDLCIGNVCVNNAVSNCLNCNSVQECNDGDSCTRDICSNGKCFYNSITTCVSNDGCCPSSCSYMTDNDCPSVCGNNVREGEEKCDGTSLGGATCAGILGAGYTGTLLCSGCMFNTTLCASPCTQTCASLNYQCGIRPICGMSVNCGTCPTGYSCNYNGTCMNLCTPESNSAFCNRLNRECDSFTNNDNCENSRTVYCGSCLSTESCTNGQCVSSGTTNPPTNPSGDIYYVSPSGSDTNGDGSIQKPWFSLNKAWGYVGPGDIIYMRGGTYRYNKQTLSGKSGSSGNYINVWAYPYDNLKPSITKSSSYVAQWPNALIYVPNGNYLYFKGIEIYGFEQENEGIWSGLWVFNSENSIFEQLNIHHCGNGAMFENINNCLILNSDFHHNLDPLTNYDPYGNADGVGIMGESTSSVNTFKGCRFWWNTDDGIDLWHYEGSLIIDNCWSWYNGFIPDTFEEAGNGNGFKLGDTQAILPNTVLRTLTNSLGVYNKNWGFLDNGANCNIRLYNNLAYNNCYRGYAEGWCGGYHFNLVQGIPYHMKNNIAYNNGEMDAVIDILTNVNHNSWDTNGISVSNSDFVSLDVSQLDNERKQDGSLPDITFGHLSQGSDLINKGVNVGLPYSGTAPDLGAFEYSSSVPTIPAENIRYVSKTGVDSSSRDGSIGQEWASLSYACSRVKTAGYTIHVNPGNYIDNNKCDLAIGVSIEGERNSPPNITTSYTYGVSKIYGYIELNSPAGNAVNGNQSISYINFNGNSKASYRAIAVNYRSNVEVHHCNFSYFRLSGVAFHGTTSSWDVAPQNILPTGNQVHDCFFKSCANLHRTETNLWEAGHIRPEGQSGMRIYNNVFYQKDQAEGYNADIIAGYQNDGLKLYNNVFYKNDIEGDEWNFFYEMHYHRGGIEIYNNTFYGASTVDFSGTIKGKYDFGGKIYNNSFIANSIPPTNSRHQGYIDVETFTYVNDLYIYNNYFKNARTGIHINNAQISMNNIWVYNNIIEGVGNSNNSYSNGIVVESNWGDNTPTPIDNVYIYNNVITAAKNTHSGIYVSAGGDISNLNIKNNIIKGSFSYPIRITDRDLNTEINGLNINNNLFHGTSSSSISYSSDLTYNNRNDNGNLVNIDPLFVGGSPYNFRLTSSSPARSKGVYVGLDRDYAGQSWNNPPSIGAYEYK